MKRRWWWLALICLVAVWTIVDGVGVRRAHTAVSPSVQRLDAVPLPPRLDPPTHRWTPRLAIENHYPTALEIEGRYPTLIAAETSYPTALDLETTYPLQWGLGVARHAGGPQPPSIALTFDTEIPHGEEARRTLVEVLDRLRDAGVHSTFFVVGWWARANPGMLRRMVAEGHEVASHSLTHQRFENRPIGELHNELEQVAQIVLRETGTPIAPLFRPPYGCIDGPAARLVRDDGYRLTGWTATGRDARSETQTAGEVVAAVASRLHNGEILLLHTNHWITAAALPDILRLVREHGLEPVTVSELLRRDPADATQLAAGGLHDCNAVTAHASQAVQTTAR